jgi:hypothetical protein
MNFYINSSFFNKKFYILAYKTAYKNRNSKEILNKIIDVYKKTDPYKIEKYVTRNIKK